MTTDLPPQVHRDGLLVQLTELNNRGRWYSSQLWQVPFAFLTIAGLLFSEALERRPDKVHLASFAIATFGICVLIHMHGMMDGERRAVQHIQSTEKALGLPQTAEYKSAFYVRPLYLLVAFATSLALLAGICVRLPANA